MRFRAADGRDGSGTLPFAGKSGLLLINPSAGRGRAARLGARTEEALRQQGLQLTVATTAGLRDATERARAAAPGSLVAALGGDGFLGAVAAGVSDAGAVLLPLAGGRGNDTVRRLGLRLDPRRAVADLPRLAEVDIDLGMADGRPFLGVAHAGLDAVANEFGNASRVPLGPFTYLYGGVRALRAWRTTTFSISVDGTPRTVRAWSVAVGNTGQYGGGLRICPDARVDDGLLDVVVLADSSVPAVVATYLGSYAGRHVSRPGVDVERATRVIIDADRPLDLYADGERIGPLPAVITIRPKALKVLVPPRSAALTPAASHPG